MKFVLDRDHRVRYIRIMASLQAYTARGNRYWRIVESFRDAQGRPRLRVLRHVGTAQSMLQQLSQAPGAPLYAEERDFGAICALWNMAQEIQLVEIIDRHAPKRHQGASVGEYLLLAAMNRALAPTSKRKLGAWYRGTVLPRWLPLPATALRSQRFWDHMHSLKEATLAKIESDLTRCLVEQQQVDIRALFYDTTNFDTFLDTENPSRLARHGHAKSKRTDLRVVGLALLVSWDFHIPLFSQVYEGNQHDSVTFSQALDELVARYQMFCQQGEHITLVFDKGNNSEDNLHTLDASPYHFIGSLVPSQHQDLLDIPLEKFHYLKEASLRGVRVYRTEKEVCGGCRTVLITHSQALLRGQVRGIRQHLAKKLGALAQLQGRVRQSRQPGWRGKPYTAESIQKQIEGILSGQYLTEFLWVKIIHQDQRLDLEYGTDQQAYLRLKQRVLGKRILFTSNSELSDEQIVLGYCGQHHVERAFREMKDPYFIRFSPAFHWTDAMIRVHAFYCVLALTLTALLHRRVRAAGLSMSLEQLLMHLKSIKEVTTFYPASNAPGKALGGRPRAERTLTRLDAQQKKILVALKIPLK